VLAKPGHAQVDGPEPAQPPAVGLRAYVLLWLGLVFWLSHEYLVLNRVLDGKSVLKTLVLKGLLLSPGQKLIPDPGGPLSYRLGWWGFVIMALTNLYILRKRLPALQGKGAVGDWLDFHIFCGLVGPTLIVFHCNFKVAGLVAISFWCMVISFASGVVGRYLYTQLLRQRGDLKAAIAQYDDAFKRWLKAAAERVTPATLQGLKDRAFAFAGGSEAMLSGRAPLLQVVVDSIAGDLRLLVKAPPAPRGLPKELRRTLRDYGLTKRRLVAATYFRRLMGYWHTFHAPFAVFMYVVSVIHIVAALVFRVRH
jgi:hypothetical protein